MPKIEVNENLFFSLLGRRCDASELEDILTSAKAELDEWITEGPDVPENLRAAGHQDRAQRYQPSRPLVHRRPRPSPQDSRDGGQAGLSLLLARGRQGPRDSPGHRRGERQGCPSLPRGALRFGQGHNRRAAQGCHSDAGEALLEFRSQAPFRLDGHLPQRDYPVARPVQGRRARFGPLRAPAGRQAHDSHRDPARAP